MLQYTIETGYTDYENNEYVDDYVFTTKDFHEAAKTYLESTMASLCA